MYGHDTILEEIQNCNRHRTLPSLSYIFNFYVETALRREVWTVRKKHFNPREKLSPLDIMAMARYLIDIDPVFARWAQFKTVAMYGAVRKIARRDDPASPTPNASW
jgi:hypothetical protein